MARVCALVVLTVRAGVVVGEDTREGAVTNVKPLFSEKSKEHKFDGEIKQQT